MGICIECQKETKKLKRFFCNSCYERHRKNKDFQVDHFDRDVELTNYQTECLTGMLLGDAYLESNGKTTRLIVQRSYRDLGYANFQYKIFENICKSGISIRSSYDKRISKNTYSATFRTRYINQLQNIYDLWYKDKIKLIPKDLALSPTIIALWFLDDGSTSIIKNGRLSTSFATQGFSYDENLKLADLLSKRYNSYFGVSKSRDKFQLSASDGSSRRLFREIDNFIPNCMLRKAKWRKEIVGLYSNRKEYLCDGTSGPPKSL